MAITAILALTGILQVSGPTLVFDEQGKTPGVWDE
jgi:hypothetical protein